MLIIPIFVVLSAADREEVVHGEERLSKAAAVRPTLLYNNSLLCFLLSSSIQNLLFLLLVSLQIINGVAVDSIVVVSVVVIKNFGINKFYS